MGMHYLYLFFYHKWLEQAKDSSLLVVNEPRVTAVANDGQSVVHVGFYCKFQFSTGDTFY